MKENWSIKSRAHRCALSDEPFSDGQKIHAALFPDPESSGYLRHDYAQESWKNLPPETPQPFSHWQTTYEAPVPEKKAETVVKDDPESLLRRLLDEDEAHSENARYILAVMLERKKILRETDTQKIPSGLLRVYEQRKTGEIYLIKDPQIPLSQVELVQGEIRELLESTNDTRR